MANFDIKTGRNQPDLNKLIKFFFFAYVIGNLTGICLDTISYFTDRLWFLFSFNLFTLTVTSVLLTLLFLQKTNIKVVNLIFLYILALNLISTDLYNIHYNIADWQPILFRNAVIYIVTIIVSGIINGNKHVIILDLLYLLFLIIAVTISESNYFTANSFILFLLATGFSTCVIVYMTVLRNTLTLKAELQKTIFEKDIELLFEKHELEIEKSLFLQQSIELKNKELTTNALILAQHFELQKKIRSDLNSIQNGDQKHRESKMTSLISELSVFNQSDHWAEFQKRFEEVHIDFYKKLITDYPTLSPAELKLAALIKLSLSSKDIAAITQNTVQSIEVSRSRLRKKLNIDLSFNLVEFLNTI